MKIILTDVESRKSFDVVNIYQRHYNCEVVLTASKDWSFQLPLIYGQKIHKLRIDSYLNFASDFDEVLQAHSNDQLVYIPLSDKTTKLFYNFIEKNTYANLKYLLPPKKEYYRACNKIDFQKYCDLNGFPVPRAYNRADLDELAENFRPLIVKPFIGAGSVGLRHIEDSKDLDYLATIEFDAYLVQEKILSQSKVCGAFFLCQNGQVLNSYTHQRLRTFPSKGGVTVYSKTVDNKEIIDIGERLLEKMQWNGLAMIEFLYDEKNDNWKIIELNPRLWGSVLLCPFAGNTMLINYAKSSAEEAVQAGDRFKEVYIRWLIPFDFISLFKGELKIEEFFQFRIRNTAYINFTYSNVLRSVLYLLYFVVNFSSIRRFFKKIFS